MPELPIMPLDTGAYLGDTLHLGTIEHGAYLMMLIVAWRTHDCALPDDPAYLAKITKLGHRWPRYADTLLAFWERKDGRLINRKLLKERERAQDRAQPGRKNAPSSAAKSLDSQQPDFFEGAGTYPYPDPIGKYAKPSARLKPQTIEQVKDMIRPQGLDLYALIEQWDTFSARQGVRVRRPDEAFKKWVWNRVGMERGQG